MSIFLAATLVNEMHTAERQFLLEKQTLSKEESLIHYTHQFPKGREKTYNQGRLDKGWYIPLCRVCSFNCSKALAELKWACGKK
jgi:hypothetical protein